MRSKERNHFDLVIRFMLIEITRYADEGFVSYLQDKGDIQINGCHCFAHHEDQYMLSGYPFEQRKTQKRNVVVVDDSLEVWTRNLYYFANDNGYGHIVICCETWDKTQPSWIKMPLWWVRMNVEGILHHEGDCVGYFATDIILEVD